MSFPYFCDGSPDGRGRHWIADDWACTQCNLTVPLGERGRFLEGTTEEQKVAAHQTLVDDIKKTLEQAS